jgi:hypothetical protein
LSAIITFVKDNATPWDEPLEAGTIFRLPPDLAAYGVYNAENISTFHSHLGALACRIIVDYKRREGRARHRG